MLWANANSKNTVLSAAVPFVERINFYATSSNESFKIMRCSMIMC